MTRERSALLAVAIRRPVTVLMLLLTLGVVGLIAYQRIPIQAMPPFRDSQVSVSISVPDSTPREVMERVAEPAEELLRTIPGVTRVESRSRSDSCRITVYYGPESDGTAVYDDIRDRMERLLPSLPEGTDRYRLFRFNLEVDFPVFMMAVSFDETVEEPDALLENVVRPRLEALDGVARVDIHGVVDREVELELDPDAVRAYGVNVQRLIQRLREDNLIAPGGVVDDGGRRYLLRLATRFADFDELRSYPVDDSLVLGQIAQVGFRRGLRTFMARVDGQVCRIVQILKESEANTVQTCDSVNAEIERLGRDPRLAGFRFIPYLSLGEIIEASLAGLQQTCLWGGLLAVVVLFLFLGHLRLTLLIAAAIPLSLTIAVVMIFAQGGTFNILSLCGLTLGIGMLIDNAIVVADSIFRQRQRGVAPREASRAGVQEVALAITLATLTTVAVFLPLIFLSGNSTINRMLSELGLPVCYSLIASLGVALIVVPLAMVYVPFGRKDPSTAEPTGTADSASNAPRGFERLLDFSLRHRFLTLAVCACALGSVWVPLHLMKLQHRGEEATSQVQFDVECPPFFSLRETDEVMEEIRKACEPVRGALRVGTMAAWYGSRGGTFSFFLEPEARTSQREFLEEIRPLLPDLPGVTIRIENDELDESDARWGFTAHGRDPAVLAALMGRIRDELEVSPAVLEVTSANEDTPEEIVVQVVREQAQRFRVSPTQVSNLVSWALRGAPLTDFHFGSEELPFWIRYAGGDLENIGDLYQVPVYAEDGTEIPVANLATFGVDRGSAEIRRVNGRVASSLDALLNASADPADLDRWAHRVFSEIAPEGYEITQDRRQFDEIQDTINAGLLGLVLVFVLMGVLFESFLMPVAVVIAMPFLALGAYWLAYLLDSPVDMIGRIGFVILLGIVVNNGIVLIDCIHRFRRESSDRRTAVTRASAARIRPILMTTCTTVFGLLPLVIFPQRGEGIDYRPLAVVVMGGLITSTLFTLVVVPVSYTLLDDLREKLLGGIQLIRQPRRSAATSAHDVAARE
ncbi:MAG: efflux RND transporter permease subunit [Planctomycetota bacterium]